MILLRTEFALIFLLVAAHSAIAQQGIPSAATPISGQINRYESVSAVVACDTVVRVRAVTQFRAGDEDEGRKDPRTE